MINYTSAIPPVTAIQQFQTGYIIETPQDNIIKYQEPYNFEFHVFNISNGYPVTKDIGCSMHIYDSFGAHIYNGYDDTASVDFDYSFEINAENFTVTQNAYYHVQCNNTVLGGYASNLLLVTPSGEESTTSESILYFIFTFIFFGLIILNFYFIIILPGGNIKDERGDIMGIVKLKYVRIVLIAISYPLVLILLNFMNGLAINFTSLTIFAGILGFLFETMISGAWIFTLLIIIWIFYNLIRDSNLNKKLKKYKNMRI
jgi:hypothetical protein